jgi:hypothetical protein
MHIDARAFVPEPREPFGGVVAGTKLGPERFSISEAANDRYWAGAGIDHPLRRSRTLYPPMAANLSILALQTVVPRPLLQTAQQLACHAAATAPCDLVVEGTVTRRFTKRDRPYLEATLDVATADGRALWTSVATFCEAS